MRWSVARATAARFGGILAGTGALFAVGGAPARAQGARLRSDVEAELPRAEAAFRAHPTDPTARRGYAQVLYRLGNVWQAREIIAPLAAPASADTADLALAARLAYL